MKTLLISVDHVDETGKFWVDSRIKNKPITWQDDETIHQAIARAIRENDYCEVSYKRKPQGNIYHDTVDGTAKIVGYHYRTKHYIENRSDNIRKDNVPFTTCVTVHGEMVEPTLEDIEL